MQKSKRTLKFPPFLKGQGGFLLLLLFLALLLSQTLSAYTPPPSKHCKRCKGKHLLDEHVDIQRFLEKNFEMCTICFENPSDTFNEKCKHLCVCHNCVEPPAEGNDDELVVLLESDSVENNRRNVKECPICRAPVTKWNTIYLSGLR